VPHRDDESHADLEAVRLATHNHHFQYIVSHTHTTMRRRQFIAGLTAPGVAGAAGCASVRDDEASAAVRARNWRPSPIRARLSVTPATPGT
jgi:hypothetical protein